MQADIDRLMEGELGQWLASQTEVRKQAKRKSVLTLIIGAAIAAVLTALVWFFVPDLPWALLLFTFVGFSLCGVIVALAPVKRLNRTMKLGINAAIADALGVTYSEAVQRGPEWKAAFVSVLLGFGRWWRRVV